VAPYTPSATGDQARERAGRPTTGQAVPRAGGSAYVPPYYRPSYPSYGYYPYGYGAYGLGYFYIDPFWWSYPYAGWGYGGGSYYGRNYDYGAIRLQVKPGNAEVYVDGYYVGQVDEFDGVFHHLELEAGPHRVEIRAAGFEPLVFEIRTQPGRTINYRGEMRPLRTEDR
jgi:hypothetical protein